MFCRLLSPFFIGLMKSIKCCKFYSKPIPHKCSASSDVCGWPQAATVAPVHMCLFFSCKMLSILPILPPLIQECPDPPFHWWQSDTMCEFHMLAGSMCLFVLGVSQTVLLLLLYNLPLYFFLTPRSTGSARWEMFGSWRTQMPNSGI